MKTCLRFPSRASAACLMVVLLAVCCHAEDVAAKRPNVILILTDDLGYGDIAAHGNPILRTPHLDWLQAGAALMTGKYPHRVRVWHTIAGGNHLREGEITMADVFRPNGYRSAIFGEWHLYCPYQPRFHPVSPGGQPATAAR